MNSIILFSNAFLYVFFSFCNSAVANDAVGHLGEHNVSTIKFCKDPDRCKAHPYSRCVESIKNNELGFDCLCEEHPYIEQESVTFNDAAKLFKLQNCRVKQGMCNDAAYSCADKVNATCHFVVEHNQAGALQAYTFCLCKKSGLVLADRSHHCYETCHDECKNSNHCGFGQAGKDGKPTVVCNCKEGFSGDRCEKKVDAKAVAETK
ncbi:hypothetical protein TYRP_011763 [Tyrophagus putrescentiae]|nr:hypothetical protein TYRP_011763 [Tyrophagus putrescentiae]